MSNVEFNMEDPEVRRAWKDNFAMAFKDRYHQYKHEHKKSYLSREDIHIIANEAAEHFITQIE